MVGAICDHIQLLCEVCPAFGQLQQDGVAKPVARNGGLIHLKVFQTTNASVLEAVGREFGNI